MFAIIRRLMQRKIFEDASLIAFPPSVSPRCCQVFRNVIDQPLEQELWEEVQPFLEKEGEKMHAGPNADAVASAVRNVQVNLQGFEPTAEVLDVRTMKKQLLRGLVWTPKLMKVAEKIGNDILGSKVDSVRVTEHQLPGEIMHMEGPTLGSAYAVLSILSPCVYAFDREEKGQRGEVMLPERGVMRVSGELRWGWRRGQSNQEVVDFISPKGTRREVETEYRISFLMFTRNDGMIDQRELTESLVGMADNARQVGEEQNAEVVREEEGAGKLGGDLAFQKEPEQARSDMMLDTTAIKKSMSRLESTVKEFADRHCAGENVDEKWLRSRLEIPEDGEIDPQSGLDLSKPLKAWQILEEKAAAGKAKLQAMEYERSK